MAAKAVKAAKAAKRNIMRIELNDTAKKKLATLSEKHGMTQVAMMSRLVDNFADQDGDTQHAMMQPDFVRGEIAAMLLKRLAGKAK